jgi:hypothetical protein
VSVDVSEPPKWRITLVADFEADDDESADAICQRLVDHVLEYPASVEVEAWCEKVQA